jgi:microcystin-dependent protein
MSEPFVGEIRMFAGSFAPRGWAFCDGQLLAVSQNDALFSLLGTIYGGDGRTTFGLPDMRGRIPVHAGFGPGLSSRQLGARGGAENVTLTVNQLPSHGHAMQASTNPADSGYPAGRVVANTDPLPIYNANAADTPAAGTQTGEEGGSQDHTNIMPFLCINFIIALIGIYPSRN